MQNNTHRRIEYKWGEFCDQDQLYYLAYAACEGLEEEHQHEEQHGACEVHNRFTEWLDNLFAVEASVLGFNTEV